MGCFRHLKLITSLLLCVQQILSMSLACALRRAVRPAVARVGSVRLLGSGHHREKDNSIIDPKWFQGREPGEPIENPIKPGLLFPPVFDGPNAPTDEEYKSGKVSVPIVVDTLEWMLSSPPPLHQFDESPIIVEFPAEDHPSH